MKNTVLEKKSLTIVVPAFNEAARISKTVSEIYAAARELLDEFEVIVIDDASTDQTRLTAETIAKKLGPEITIITHQHNQGIGGAFATALQHAKYDTITSFPGDGAYTVEGIRALFLVINTTPVILGYRTNQHLRPLLRRFLSGCVTRYVRLLTGKKIIDAQGMFVAPVALTKQFQIHYSRNNFQMQWVSFILNHDIPYLEIPVSYNITADQHSGMIQWRVLLDVIFSSLMLLYIKLTGRLKAKRNCNGDYQN